MLKLTISSPDSANDDEVAAVMAAIFAYRKSREVPVSEVVQRPGANWKLASTLEATGRSGRLTTPPSRELRRNAWKATPLPKLFSLLVSLMLCGGINGTAANAQQMQSPPAAPNAVT